MNRVVKYLTGPVRRAWRVRGFGVHSPFAYASLRSVIHPQGGARYYAEDSLASRRGRLLYRAAVEAGPEAMLTVGPDTTLGTPSGEIRTYVATDPEAIVLLERWAATLECGVMFRGPSMAIFCLRRGIPRQRLEVAMP